MIINDDKGLFPFGLEYTVGHGRGNAPGFPPPFGSQRILKRPFRIMQYYYPIAELQEEIYKRSSILARHTPSQNGSQFDKATLSTDEKETFDELCQKAADEVAVVLQPFLPLAERAYLYDKGYIVPVNSVPAGEYALVGGTLYMALVDSHTSNVGTKDFEELTENVSHTVHFICKKYIDVYENSVQSTDRAIREMLLAYIMKEWTSIALPERYTQYAEKYEEAREKLRFSINNLIKPVRQGHIF